MLNIAMCWVDGTVSAVSLVPGSVECAVYSTAHIFMRNKENVQIVCTYVFHRIESQLYLRTCFGALIAPVALALNHQ